MDAIQTIILALVQGITEFLPISSSAHLILPFNIFGWADQGLAFDAAVHLGTLTAVLWFFRLELVELISAFFKHLAGKPSESSYFAINLLLASLPIIPIGFLAKDLIAAELRSLHIIIATTIIFGLVLYIADKKSSGKYKAQDLKWQDALVIGFAQCLALIPGTSRSGITMSLALFLGYNREAASRISFLMAIPTILGASVLMGADLFQQQAPVDWGSMLLGFSISAVTAYFCIKYFLDYINKIGFTPFVIYRLLLGFGLLGLVMMGLA